jgi:nucleoside-diphosphate-sugar epimerase
MTNLHVVFGSGPLGTGVAALLTERGERVRVVNRSGVSSVAGAEVKRGSVADAGFAAEAAAGASTVYQCAQPPYHRWPAEFAAFQQNIVDAAAAANARLVIADNLYAYGDPHGEVISDSSPRSPTTVKGLLRKEMADSALADPRLEVTISRPSNYIGPGYELVGKPIIRPALRGKPMQFLGRMDVAHSFSYVPDIAAAMVALASSEKSWGRGWITPVMPALTQSDLAALVWAAAGASGSSRATSLGRGMAGVLGAFVPDLRALLELWYEWDSPFVVDSSEFSREFGVVATPVEQAVEATVEWYRR